MLVKAKWNVRDESGWHCCGDVFQTDADLGESVEVLDAPKKAEKAAEAPVKEAPADEEKPKAPSRRKKTLA